MPPADPETRAAIDSHPGRNAEGEPTAARPTQTGLAQAGRRDIFRYFDGTRERGIDPLLVARRMAAHPKFNPEVHWPAVAKDPPDFEALDTLIEAVHDVFEVKPWSEDESGRESGLTDTECVSLFLQFDAYGNHLKKNGESSLTSQQPTEAPGSPQSNQNSNTSDSSGSGSTSDALKPAKPGGS